MNQDWEIRSFEDCIERVSSSNKIPKKKFLTSGQFPIISQEDEYINGYWDKPEDLFKVEKPIVIFGDHTTKLKYIDFDFVKGADGIKVLLPKKDLNTLFFYYQLQSISFDDLGYARHYRLLKKEKIVIPTLEEQKQIVAKLDQAFAAINTAKLNIEKNLENTKELITSLSIEIFSSSKKNDYKTIGELTDIVTDYVANGSFASLKENVDYKKEEDYAILLRLLDHSNKFKKDFIYIDKEAYEFLSKSKLYPGDIIISNIGARLGTVFKAPDLKKPMSLAPNSILLKSNEFGDYLYCWLKSKYGQKEIKSIVAGAGQPKFNKTDFKKITIPIPENKNKRIEIITKINFLDEFYRNISFKYQQKLDSLKELKKSILEKAFADEL